MADSLETKSEKGNDKFRKKRRKKEKEKEKKKGGGGMVKTLVLIERL